MTQSGRTNANTDFIIVVGRKPTSANRRLG
jgi:hypothetical protein